MNVWKNNLKRGFAILLTAVLAVGLLQIMPGSKSAVQAADGSGNAPSVTAFATKDELMNTFQQDGSNTTIGKIIFGKDSDGNALEWYILGQDSGVKDAAEKTENIVIFAASPIITGQQFEDDYSNNKTDWNLWSDCNYAGGAAITEVYPNHYGASDLRAALKGIATNTDYFTIAEQSLMQATTITTNDTKNSTKYTTTDVLYALSADGYGRDYTNIKAGSSDDKILPMTTYWSSDYLFWLRSPSDTYVSNVHWADTGYYVLEYRVNNNSAVRPASNLNLSSVLFASAAAAATSDTVLAETIAESTAMTLRLDGSNTDIGSVMYDSTQGMLLAKKSDSATDTVSVVVQGNDGTDDWYFSKVITGTEVIKASDIKTALGLSAEVELSDCKIWIETTIVGVIYAKEVTETAITQVNSVELTDITAPVSKTELDTDILTGSTGLWANTPKVIWTVDGNVVTGNAEYNTSYTANVTIDINDTAYFASNVTTTVNGENATVTANTDRTITVSYTFPATEKAAITYTATGYEGIYDSKEHSITVSVTAPTDAKISYSTDNKTYSENNPAFTEAGEYTVYFKIEKENYITVTDSETVKIGEKATDDIPGNPDAGYNNHIYLWLMLLVGSGVAMLGFCRKCISDDRM